jgi:hypothetical protein
MVALWVANMMLKGITELNDYSIDFDERKAYVQTTLYGEEETIEVWLDGFAIINDGESQSFIIEQAKSNRPWLNNLLARVVGKAWKIPVIPEFTSQIEIITELLKAESPAEEGLID